MSFEITARTILHLGADLISSDAVALYELIKNSIDAKSTSGVDVVFEIVIRSSDVSTVLDMIESRDGLTLEILKAETLNRILINAPDELKAEFVAAVQSAKSIAEFKRKITEAYRWCNRIVVSDSGHGMSHDDLKYVFLTIGTTSRAKAVNDSLSAGNEKTPYLGEKGVGRLSAMRLGKHLRIETATVDDDRTNILVIDWSEFERAYDKPASSVKITPEFGERKKLGVSFTRVIISDISAAWTADRLLNIARTQISRMMDPFSWAEKRRFQVRLEFNGTAVDQVKVVAKGLLDNAHGKCSGRYEIVSGSPKLTVNIESSLYDGPKTEHVFDLSDLYAQSGLKQSGQPHSILKTLGPFTFEFYWYNRQRLKAMEGVGDREAVRSLIKAWTGICLFRDGYRVLPYGDAGDDWLGLDREALAASGYKLNTKQLIGRVNISRNNNPKLLDQTNRQGLKDCPESEVLVQLLNIVVSRWWHDYLNDAGKVQKRQTELSYDSIKESSAVDTLEQRTKATLKAIRRDFDGDARLLEQVKDAFLEVKEAHARAVLRISTVEEEKDRLTQLAGVGLMVEVIAHELTRATELTQVTLKRIGKKSVDEETAAAFKVLGQQIKVIQKRLHTLEPLSVSARQRRSSINIFDVLTYVLDAHVAQFERHKISASIAANSKMASAFIIEGHLVQILENLINNSIYWIDVFRCEHTNFHGEIFIEILESPLRIKYSDNGPGIPAARQESVFEAFYSTKNTSVTRRQGLGLYIARQNAEMLGGGLYLVDVGRYRSDRFNTFELEWKESKE